MALPELLGSVTPAQLGGFAVLFCVVSFIIDIANIPRYPEQIPVVGKGRGSLNRLLNGFLYLSRYRSWISDGYNKYSKKGVAFIAPSWLFRVPDVVMPQSQVVWMMDQPDDILSTYDAHNAVLYSKYNFLGRRLAYDPFPNRVMHKFLARHLSSVLPNMDDEIQHAVETSVGHVTENWKTVNLWNLWLEIVPRVTNRLLVGEGVCRDKQFLDGMINFTNSVVRNNFFLQLFPQSLHPIFGRLLTISNWLHWRSADARVRPVIQQRLDAMTKKAAGDPEYKDYVPPEEFITWLIRLAMAEGKTFELDPSVISKRLLPIEFAAIHTTVLTGQQWMFDLLSSDPETGILDTLRAEIRAHKPESGPWTKAAITNLVRLDSSIRESQRVNNFSLTLIERQVVAREGLHNPEMGWTLPKGTFVTVNLHGTHHDGDLFERPEEYDPLRYSRLREAWEMKSAEEKQREADEASRMRGLGMVTTSSSHLAFGHGRHACPGRFFVAHEMKLILAYMLLNYDLRMVDKLPERQWIGGIIIPNLKGTIEIRRRKTET